MPAFSVSEFVIVRLGAVFDFSKGLDSEFYVYRTVSAGLQLVERCTFYCVDFYGGVLLVGVDDNRAQGVDWCCPGFLRHRVLSFLV